MNQTSSHKRILRMVQIALLSALVLVIHFFFAQARIGIIEMNFCLIPIVIAGAYIDPLAGFIVGAFSGIATFYQVLTIGGSLYTLLVNTNVVVTALLCFLKVSLAGLLCGFVFRLLRKFKLNPFLSSLIASAVCPIVNTAIFCLGMFTVFAPALIASPDFVGDNIFNIVIFVLVGPNFFVELLSTVIITPILGQALISAKVFKNV